MYTSDGALGGICHDDKVVGLPSAGASRWGLLAASGITFLGLMKLNVSGPGITSTVKSLWHKPEKQ